MELYEKCQEIIEDILDIFRKKEIWVQIGL